MLNSRSERTAVPPTPPPSPDAVGAAGVAQSMPAAVPFALPLTLPDKPRILLVKVSSLGDVVHNMPLVHDLRARWPGAEIDWVVEEGYVELVRLLPEVRRVIPFALRRWRKRILQGATWQEMGAVRDALRQERYDAVIESQGLLKTAVVARVATRAPGAPIIGLGNATQGSGYEPAARLLYTDAVRVPRQTHSVRRSRLLGAALTGIAPAEPPQFFGPAAQSLHADDPLWADLPARYAVCFHATAGARKKWAVQNWHALGNRLAAEGLTMLLPWGNDKERQAAEEIAAGVPQARVLPKFSVMQGFGLINRAEVVIGVDTGLVHIAAALCRPTVEIYTATWRWKTEGYWSGRIANVGDDGVVPSVDEVYEAARRVRGVAA
ncbi:MULTISPECIES: lipopolysaccharide heptosyltransferase I [unclassified Cupriavidus]|uniref:lipopolysaccharide heptosyltransferase I n=1 Tax=unclassified Cupriavidus TaxID=2640874 RepID=UPI00048ADE08|nr:MULTISPECIES: lipopolysaccharide heptosyltransferase I [unclassified Cupriavidus]MBP0634014.1 lipopolysaccharide heptosyltransferase I [Cupriavidus sp. AcVe19-6a]